MDITIRNQAALPVLAKRILNGQPHIIALVGPLGAGKTTFTQALAQELGVKESVTSPTFALQHIYSAHHPAFDTLVHVDCYRLQNPDAELPALDLAHWLQQPRTLVVIEWADRIKTFLADKKVVWVALSVQSDGSRKVVLK